MRHFFKNKIAAVMFMLLVGAGSTSEAQTTLLECVMEMAPVEHVSVMTWAGQMRIVERFRSGSWSSREMDPADWEARTIYLTAEPGTKAVLFLEDSQWQYLFQSKNSYMRGGAICSY